MDDYLLWRRRGLWSAPLYSWSLSQPFFAVFCNNISAYTLVSKNFSCHPELRVPRSEDFLSRTIRPKRKRVFSLRLSIWVLTLVLFRFSLMGSERHPWSPAILRHTFGPVDPPISCLVSFIGTDKIYRLLSTCNKAAASTAARDQDWKLAGKSGQSFSSVCFPGIFILLLLHAADMISDLIPETEMNKCPQKFKTIYLLS